MRLVLLLTGAVVGASCNGNLCDDATCSQLGGTAMKTVYSCIEKKPGMPTSYELKADDIPLVDCDDGDGETACRKAYDAALADVCGANGALRGSGFNGVCRQCGATSDCVKGLRCQRRRCDGLQVCAAPGEADACRNSAGDVCPEVPEWGVCDGRETGCAVGMQCAESPGYPGKRCVRPCTNRDECVNSPAADFDNREQKCLAGASGTATSCSLHCSTIALRCPFGGTCRLASGQVEGFCW